MLNIRIGWWTYPLAACILALPGRGAAGQKITKDAPAKATAPGGPGGPTTQMGVYTSEQASRGKNVYAGSCKSCHAAESHTGATFAKFWRGKPLSDLFTFVSTRMPKNDPGSLAPEDVADVVAYLLRMNAMPTGAQEIYPDADSLKQFRIETKKVAASTKSSTSRPTTAKRKTP